MVMPKKIFTIIIITLASILPISTNALSVIPNDPYYNKQYYINQTRTDEAWGYSTGSPNVIIAVIDSGIDITHPDLKNNIWKNTKEIPENNIDDDHNGFVDDINGWNFVENNNDPEPQYDDYTTEGASHGTIVAGIIAASGNNNEGIAGIAWNSKIMAIRALNSRGEGTMDHAIKAIQYAADNGASVINFSFVGSNYNQELSNMVEYAYRKGAVLVAAIGNDALGSTSLLAGGNLDVRPVYPACFKNDSDIFVIGVGSVGKDNRKTDFSNFGKTCININAPGVEFVGTQARNSSLGEPFTASYSGFWNGTSFSSPQVAGIAALIKSFNPNFTNKEIISIILNTADNLDSYNNPELTGLLGKGVLNGRRALRAAAPANFTPRDPIEELNLAKNNAALWNSGDISKESLVTTLLPINLSFQNHGMISWDPAFLSLSLSDWNGKSIAFSPSEIPYQNNAQTVFPSQIATFSTTIQTPKSSAAYNIKFQLNYKGIPIKGGAIYKTIEVNPKDQAKIASQTIPIAVLKQWGSARVNIKVTNLSKDIWNKETTVLTLSKNSAKINHAQWINESSISMSKEQTIPAGGTATFSFPIQFSGLSKGRINFSFQLNVNGKILDIEGADRVMRID